MAGWRRNILIFRKVREVRVSCSSPNKVRLIIPLHPPYHNLFPELVKINHYKAPRDKLICILNSCKVIFGPLPFSKSLDSLPLTTLWNRLDSPFTQRRRSRRFCPDPHFRSTKSKPRASLIKRRVSTYTLVIIFIIINFQIHQSVPKSG